MTLFFENATFLFIHIETSKQPRKNNDDPK